MLVAHLVAGGRQTVVASGGRGFNQLEDRTALVRVERPIHLRVHLAVDDTRVVGAQKLIHISGVERPKVRGLAALHVYNAEPLPLSERCTPARTSRNLRPCHLISLSAA